MFLNSFSTSLRILLKTKAFSIINILGLAAGMAAVLIIFMWVRDELSFEQYHEKADQVFLAYLMMTAGNDSIWEQVGYQATTAPAVAPELLARYPEVEKAARCGDLGETIFSLGDDAVVEPSGLAIEPSLFDILTFQFLMGDRETALSQPHSIVITEKLSKKYFPGRDPLGNTIRLNNESTFTVTGVISDMPENAYRKYDFLVPFTYLEELGFDIRSTRMFYPCAYYTYVLLQKGADMDSLNAKLSQHLYFTGKEARAKIGFVNLKNVYLTETGGTTRIYIFSLIALIILIIACINYTNLSAASAIGRLKEIFTRKVNGAERKHLIFQFFSESLLASLISMGIGIAFLLWFLPTFNQLTSKQITFSLLNPSTLTAVLLIIVLTSLLAGMYPAFLLSTIKTRGTSLLNSKTTGRKGHFQRILMFIQITLTVIFLISSIVIYRQSHYIRNFALGLNKNNVLYTNLGGSIQGKIPLIKSELLKNTDIVSVSSGSSLPNAIRNGSYWVWGTPDKPGTRMAFLQADYDYLKTFDIQLAKGRFYDPAYSSDSADGIIVNEAALKKLGIPIPIDSQFYFNQKNRKLLGVVKDFQHNSPLNILSEPLGIFLSENNNTYLFIRINPRITDAQQLANTVHFIQTTGKRLSPDYPLDFRFLDTFSFPGEKTLEVWRKLVLYSSILTIVITCMGLLALISLTTNQRTREIGIYKINGAMVSGIMMKFYKSYLSWVLLANIIAWPASWFLMNWFLEDFAHKTPIAWWIFPLAGVLSVIIILATITWHIWFVARRNPVDALRHE